VAGGWRRLHNEEVYNMYASPDYGDKINQYGMDGVCSTHERDEKCIQNFGRKN